MSTQSTLAAVKTPKDWRPDSWQGFPAKQQPTYNDAAALRAATEHLAKQPPLVTSWEIESLKAQLADVAGGKRFLLQGGDCAERFDECRPDIISSRLKVLLQMSLMLVHGLQLPVVRLGRFAGQYAKPRSADLETRGDQALPSYRGDMVNHPRFDAEHREPDPQRMLQGHANSALTMNFVRALVDGGFADLHHPEYWDLGWVEHSPLAEEYQRMVEALGDSVRFMETLAGRPVGNLNRVDFFTSHEALLLPYEQAMTRNVPRQWGFFDLSTHLPWIGMRTAELDGAHVEFCRGIRNPIGIKLGPSMSNDWVRGLLDTLNPDHQPGRIVLIHRLGAAKVESQLPGLIDAVKAHGCPVVWCADPMHGNTESTSSGTKTRRFDNIKRELELAFDVHEDRGTWLGGVHLELTGENVTECLGGARDLTEDDLARKYTSSVDPRLNYEQSLELAMVIVRKRGEQRALAQLQQT